MSTSPSAKVFSVNFFACAEGAKYERFLPMYAFFALQSNRNSAVELVVPNSTLFLKRHERALTVVKQLHGRRSVWVREYRVPRHRGVMPNTRRFLEVPEIAAEYVYMGDIDILITESVLSAGRLQQMRHNAPYSNILRKNTRRLTGVILVRAREFYTRELKRAQVALLAGGNATGDDEEFLARLVTAAGFALPPANETYRRLHGLHLSNSRGPNSIGRGKAMGISDKDSQWCPVLGTPGFQEYISIDDHARTTLQSFATYAIYLHPSAQEQAWVRPLQPTASRSLAVARAGANEERKVELHGDGVRVSLEEILHKTKQDTRNELISLKSPDTVGTELTVPRREQDHINVHKFERATSSGKNQRVNHLRAPHPAAADPRPTRTGAPPGRRVLLFGVGNGLHNQLMSLVDGMVVARRYRYDVVLPMMWGGMGVRAENRSQPLGFEQLYDAPHFAACLLRSARLRVLSELPSGYIARRINATRLTGRKVNDNTNGNLAAFEQALAAASQPLPAAGVAVDIGRFYARWWYAPDDAEGFAGRRVVLGCLRPAQSVASAVSKVLAGLHARFPSGYTTIHPRLEPDWRAHCATHPLHDCLVDEAEWASRLSRRRSLGPGPGASALYVVGGARYNPRPFRAHNFSAVSKYDFVSREDLVPLRYASSLAAVDFFVALEADMAYGYMWSSMDVLLFEARRYACRPMEPIHLFRGDWVRVVSKWTRSYFHYGLDDALRHFGQAPACRPRPAGHDGARGRRLRADSTQQQAASRTMLHRQQPPEVFEHAVEDRPAPRDAPVLTPPVAAKPLRDRLLDLALLAPRDALAALDADPLGVERVTNASDWRCPADRLLASDAAPLTAPSRKALRRMREHADGAFLWFDHLSKAGGTSFCKFARKNVGFPKTPRYYCMPSDGADINGTDGRVGRWTAAKLKEYLQRTHHRVVASEWDPFPSQMMNSFRDDAVLVSIMRDPLDRLVSAHQFWGVLNNPSKNSPDPVKWLRNMDRRARSRTMAQAPRDYLGQVARNNFATWKFAFTSDGRFHDCKGDATCGQDALRAAMTTLARFHVLAPTTWQAAAGPLYAKLGWSKLEEEHVVNIGKVQDSSARKALPAADYDALREANVLDEVLWHWARRAFLEGLHCPP